MLASTNTQRHCSRSTSSSIYYETNYQNIDHIIRTNNSTGISSIINCCNNYVCSVLWLCKASFTSYTMYTVMSSHCKDLLGHVLIQIMLYTVKYSHWRLRMA